MTVVETLIVLRADRPNARVDDSVDFHNDGLTQELALQYELVQSFVRQFRGVPRTATNFVASPLSFSFSSSLSLETWRLLSATPR